MSSFRFVPFVGEAPKPIRNQQIPLVDEREVGRFVAVVALLNHFEPGR